MDNLGPFQEGADARLDNLLNDTLKFTISYRVKNLIPEEAPATANCYLW